MEVLLIYLCLAFLCLPFETFVIYLQRSSQHRIRTRTDSVVLIMVKNKGFNPLVTTGEWRKNVIFTNSSSLD